MIAAAATPDRPIRARTDEEALRKLLRESGCRLPTDRDAVEELLRDVASYSSQPNPRRDQWTPKT